LPGVTILVSQPNIPLPKSIMKDELLFLLIRRRYDNYIYKGIDKSAREGARR